MISHFLVKTHDKKIKISRRLISNTKAFTLIELMVTVGIFVLMTALILARYNSYYSGTVFANMAYDVALTIRQAQTYGISVKSDSGNVFTGSYGVHFKYTPTISGEFAIHYYTKVPNPVLGAMEKKYTLKRGARIQNICVGLSASAACTVLQPDDELDVVFQRPNPEPIVCHYIAGNNTRNCGHKYAKITLVASDGVTKKTITVSATGQISIQ